MATTITDYIAFVKNVIDALPRQFEGIVNRNQEAILDLNRETQLYDKGEDIHGFKLLDYKPFTIEIKQLIGQPYDRTTLFYSGAFYNSFKTAIKPKEYTIEIFATDKKTLDLVMKYGDIFGYQTETPPPLKSNCVLLISSICSLVFSRLALRFFNSCSACFATIDSITAIISYCFLVLSFRLFPCTFYSSSQIQKRCNLQS